MQTRYLERRDDKAARKRRRKKCCSAERIEKIRKQKEDDEKTLIYFRVLDMIQAMGPRKSRLCDVNIGSQQASSIRGTRQVFRMPEHNTGLTPLHVSSEVTKFRWMSISPAAIKSCVMILNFATTKGATVFILNFKLFENSSAFSTALGIMSVIHNYVDIITSRPG